MNAFLPDRIRKRLTNLGKSAAGASLEAGLGRSAIQNILTGHSVSPRMKTITKLASVLECSTAYLMGLTDEAGQPPVGSDGDREADLFWEEVTSVKKLEANVLRKEHLKHDLKEQAFVSQNDYRFSEKRHSVYIVADNSMVGTGIASGDLITAVDPEEEYPLRDEMVVIVSRYVEKAKYSEFSIRQVVIGKKGISLVLRPTAGSKYEDALDLDTGDAVNAVAQLSENTYFTKSGDVVRIEGIAVRLTRTLEVPGVNWI